MSAFYLDKYEVTKTLWDEVYTWTTAHAETWCQVLDLGPALTVQPGVTATLQARINNMSAYELPADARVYFDIHGLGYSSVNIFLSLRDY